YHAEDEHDEAAWVEHEMRRLHHDERLRWGEIAGFYRTNAQSRDVEQELVERGVPYKVVGGLKFYDRREVKGALAYLKPVANPADEVSIKRIVNVPKRGVGDTSIGRLDAWAAREGVSFADAMASVEKAGVSGKALGAIRDVLALLDELRSIEGSPADVLEAVLERTGYAAELEAEHTIEAAGRLENLAELVGVAREYES